MHRARHRRLLILFFCLLALLGCLGDKPGSSSPTQTAVQSSSGEQTRSSKGNSKSQIQTLSQMKSKIIYRAAVPELAEFSWDDTRVFNLPLNNPPHVRPSKADFMRSEDIVLGVILGDEARAYPWSLMANFHAANDTLNGQPIIVNLCEACNGGAAFLATLPDTVVDLRPRGLKNGTWYGIDFQTGSLWYPFIGKAFEGPLKGSKLTRIGT